MDSEAAGRLDTVSAIAASAQPGNLGPAPDGPFEHYWNRSGPAIGVRAVDPPARGPGELRRRAASPWQAGKQPSGPKHPCEGDEQSTDRQHHQRNALVRV